jgi:hypothetical protein
MRECFYVLTRFYHLVIDIEPYYGLSPIWLRVIQRPLEAAAKKRVLNETVIYEMYKKYFGRRKATTYKVIILIVRYNLFRFRSFFLFSTRIPNMVYVFLRKEVLHVSFKH